MALAVRVDELADLREQLFDQHGLVQAEAVLGLLGTENPPGTTNWYLIISVLQPQGGDAAVTGGPRTRNSLLSY